MPSNITMSNNIISTLVGKNGANSRSPSEASSGGGQSVIGVYSLNCYVKLTNTIISNLISMPFIYTYIKYK